MYRVMIADDESHIRDLLVKNIRGSFSELEVVAVSDDGKAALEAALSCRPDIVITDIAMPFMNGLELITQIQQAGIQSKYVVISGYDEFDYARQAIALGVKNYLLKPFLPREFHEVIRSIIKELDSQNTLQHNMDLLREMAQSGEGLVREKALKDLLEGRECQSPAADLDADFYLVGMIRLSGGSWNFRDQESIEKFLLLIGDGYFGADIRMHAVSFDGQQLVVIWLGSCASKDVFWHKIRTGIEKIRSSFEKYYQVQMNCALGKSYQTIAGIARSYQEAMAVWRGTLESGSGVLVYGNDSAADRETGSSSQIRDFKSQIRLSVRTGQSKAALSQLHGLIKCYSSLANKKNDYISVSARELVYAIQGDMEQAGYSRDEVEPIAGIQEKIHYSSLMEIKMLLEHYITGCCRIVSAYSEETKASAAAKQVKLLIDSNLKNTEISLDWIAEQIHFSPSYIRQIFRQHIGESFGEYLIRKRMELAGELLQKTSLRIQEVAQECGYDNQRYFASSFKKYFDCTPTEFKKMADEGRLY